MHCVSQLSNNRAFSHKAPYRLLLHVFVNLEVYLSLKILTCLHRLDLTFSMIPKAELMKAAQYLIMFNNSY